MTCPFCSHQMLDADSVLVCLGCGNVEEKHAD